MIKRKHQLLDSIFLFKTGSKGNGAVKRSNRVSIVISNRNGFLHPVCNVCTDVVIHTSAF